MKKLWPRRTKGEREVGAYLEIHRPQLFTPTRQERTADVDMKFREGVWTFRLQSTTVNRASPRIKKPPYQVGVPHPNRILYAQLSHQ